MGKYELLEIIGRGGMGVVHRARQVDVGHVVALKRIRSGELASDAEVDRFILEAKAASRLVHPNIVRIYHVEDDDGRPYFTMELHEGGSLDCHIESFRGDGRRAAELVATVARAVHYGHDRGVLHRDLKPANIMLDAKGSPHVGDFGVAKLHGEDLETTAGVVPGTPHYMAPEQAAGQDVTRAADVWSLGAILYELLTGVPPFGHAAPHELVRRVMEDEPTAPRAVVATIDRDLETICLKCLQKDPTRRYESAAKLADDLDSHSRGEPIAARPVGWPERIWRWCRRHPLRAAVTVSICTLLIGVAVVAMWVAGVQEHDLRQDILRANVYAARAQAGTVLFQLQALAKLVQTAAADPKIVAAVAEGDCRSNGDGKSLLEPYGAGTTFDSLSLFDASGAVIRRWPKPVGEEYYFCKNFGWRDYFRGAKRMGERGRRGAYVGRAIRSEADGQWKFSIAAPIFVDGRFVGTIDGTIGSDSKLFDLHPRDPGDPRRTAVLAAPRDNPRECPDCALPETYIVLLHDQLPDHGGDVPIDSPAIREIGRAVAAQATTADQFQLAPQELAIAVADHRDPLSPGDRQLAGFAPVGLTGYVMIVEMRYDAVENITQLIRFPLFVAGGTLALGLSVVALIAWLDARRKRRSSGNAPSSG